MPKWNGKGKPHRADRRWVQGWSPQQIANRLKTDFPDDESMRISHEAIYQALYVESRGALKRELVPVCAPAGHCASREPARNRKPGQFTPDVLISERPAEVEDPQSRARGRRLLIGPDRSAIGTLVKRTTPFHDAGAPATKRVPALKPAGPSTALRRAVTVRS